MLIVFEGIDHSGKSTLSVLFAEWLNNEFRDEQGQIKVDPHLGDFVWTKEPMFSSEEADRLNSPEFKDQVKRELLFFVSRTRHQRDLRSTNIVCDRYIWTGIAYAKLFSPETYKFAKELYLSEDLFVQPDLHVFVDTDPLTCHIRGTEESLEILQKKRDSYLETMKYISSPIITIESINTPVEALEILKKRFCSMFDRYKTFIG
jgi:thymidylate kinase